MGSINLRDDAATFAGHAVYMAAAREDGYVLAAAGGCGGRRIYVYKRRRGVLLKRSAPSSRRVMSGMPGGREDRRATRVRSARVGGEAGERRAKLHRRRRSLIPFPGLSRATVHTVFIYTVLLLHSRNGVIARVFAKNVEARPKRERAEKENNGRAQ